MLRYPCDKPLTHMPSGHTTMRDLRRQPPDANRPQWRFLKIGRKKFITDAHVSTAFHGEFRRQDTAIDVTHLSDQRVSAIVDELNGRIES